MANFLSEDLIFFEILARLPLKFLLRLTLICKRWHFLITNPGSAEFHIAHASYNLLNSPSLLVEWFLEVHWSGFSIVNKDQNNVSIKRINDSIVNSCKQIFSFYDSVTEISDYFGVYPEDTVSLIGSVYGLVCFCHNFTPDMFFIWNPVTKMFKPVFKPSGDSLENIHYCRSAFCYDPIDIDFRIIEMERYEMRSELGKVLLRVRAYSCKLDTWTEIRNDSIPNLDFYIAGNLKGKLYVKFGSEPNVLSAFDVHDGVCKRLPCPEHFIEGAERRHYINWKDSFGVTFYKNLNDQEPYGREVVYTFDETSSAWIEQYVVPIAPDSYPYRSLLGLEDGHIAVDDCDGYLKLFEAQSSQFKDLTSGTPAVDVMRYTESLV